MDYYRQYNKDELKSGFEPMTGNYSGMPLNGKKAERQHDTTKLNYLERIVSLSQSKGIPIAIIASPKYCDCLPSSLQPVNDICTRKGIPFLDYYSDERFMQHKELFKEPMHLNKDGARVFSTLLINDINCLLNRKN